MYKVSASILWVFIDEYITHSLHIKYTVKPKMSEKLNSLLETRRIVRGRFTKAYKTAESYASAAEKLVDSKDIAWKEIRISIREAMNALKPVEKIYDELSELQDQIEYHPENEQRLQTIEDDGEAKYYANYMTICAQVQELESALSQKPESAASESGGDVRNAEIFAECFEKALKSVNTGVSAEQLTQIIDTLTHRKRSIPIPKFKGDPELFDQWRDLVDTEVDKPGYSEVEKTHIAISLLEGDVYKLVSSLKEPSYEDIMTFLENRYGDVLSRIEKAINEIASIAVVSSPTVRELDPVYNKLAANWNYIKKRTKDDPQVIESSWILTALVRPKLPRSLVRRWDSERIKREKSIRSPSQLPTAFDDLLEKIEDALRVARRSDSTAVRTEPRRPPFREKPKSSSYALNVNKPSYTQPKTQDLECVFCNGNHQSYACPNVMNEMSVEERVDRVKTAKACFNCLSKSHMVKACRSRGCKICKKNHHTLLHRERKREAENGYACRDGASHDEKLMSPCREKVDSSVGLIKSSGGSADVIMQSGIAKLESKSAVTQGRVLLDSGSGVSFISRAMARRLNLRGPKVEGEFTLAGGKEMKISTERVRFYLSSAIPNWKGETLEIVAYVLDRPSAAMNLVDVDLSKMPHLKGLQLAERFPRPSKAEIDVMLGIEDTINLLLDKRIKGPTGTPVAQKSHIGWLLCGSYNCAKTTDGSFIGVNRVDFHLQDETEIATRYWEIEHIGILPDESKQPSELEKSAIEQHASLTSKTDGHYETGLLRHPKYQGKMLKSNKSLAYNRLLGLEKRLTKEPQLAKEYEAQIQELLAAGRAEKVTEEKEPSDRQIWYLPHHPVVRRDKTTTKVRVVFDGSMLGQEGISLNDTLLPGPALQPDLPGVLLRFRRHKVALVADIEKMFLQVKMQEVDRDSQRFLWRNLDASKEPDVYRLTTVTFGLTPSPYSSIQTVLDHVKGQKEEFPKAAQEIEENIFVDDVLTGEDSVEAAAVLAVDLKHVLGSGGFPLRKFLSNKPEALALLEEKDLASQHKSAVFAEESATKTLGVKYLPSRDVLMFSFCEKMEERDLETRRTVLQQLHRVYDPLGMLSPFTITAKQIFQKSWLTTGSWDDKLPEELQQEWKYWKEQVHILDEIEIQRCLVPEGFKDPVYSLHGFGDACEASYGCAVYLLVEDRTTGKKHSTLLCSKTRLSPIGKRRSIPELELIGALINARLVRYAEKQLKLPIEETVCWTDSQVVLHWIAKPSYTWQVFIANRVSEIQRLVPPSSWRYVPSGQNPADLCSRGVTARSLVDSKLWWTGPTFLVEEKTDWPKQTICSPDDTEEATKKSKRKMIQVLNVVPSQQDTAMEEYAKRFSSYGRFIRVMTLVRSWITKYREKKNATVRDEGSGQDTLGERKKEELRWIRWAQEKHFEDEIKVLESGEPVKKQSKLVQLKPYWDDRKKVMRVGGRLIYTTLPEETKHPIILPTHNPFVERLVMYYHILNLHTGPAQTLASLRNRYWIVHGRQEVRRILHSCRTCREPLILYQQMAPLPAERTSMIPAFMNVGVDFAGPLYVKVKVENAKVYICLFSCMVTRAIHLELVEDMTTEQFLLALKRMMSRRGRSRLIVSDNAKSFKQSSEILKRLFKNKNELREKLENQGIKWKFITERAPWHGGFYERMVGSVKRALKRVLGKSRLTQIEMQTVLTEVEAQINSRPLTVVSSSSEDLAPLTPGHLAIGRSPQSLPDIDRQTEKTSFGKRWKYQQTMLKHFWNRWSKEYLLELQKMKTWTDVRDNVKVGDVVLIAEDNQRKQDWMLGRIQVLHPGRDDLVRSVTVKTAKGLRRRPVQRLRLLEPANEDD